MSFQTRQIQTSNSVKIYRQGDLILERVEQIKYEDVIKNGTFESDRLEVRSETGNAHILNAKTYIYQDQILVIVEKPTPLIHPQHPQVLVEPGIYRVRFVRDWLLQVPRPAD